MNKNDKKQEKPEKPEKLTKRKVVGDVLFELFENIKSLYFYTINNNVLI